MTALSPTLPHAAPGPRPGAVLLRTVRAEWSRIWTVRSSWWFALALTVVVLGIGTILGVDVHGDAEPPADTAWAGGRIAGTFGFFGVLAMALVTATSDHASGGIVPTLQWTPRRGVLLTARTLVIVVTTSVLGLLLVTGASVIVHLFAPAMGLGLADAADALGTIGFVYVAGALLSVGLGMLTRSTAGGLVLVIALMLVLVLLLSLFPYEWARQVAELLPGAGALSLLTEEGITTLTAAEARLTLGAWTVAATVLGGLRLLRSDADR